MQNIFAAGSATVLLFDGTSLWGVAKTLTDSSIDASISAEEIRAGGGNLLYGKYFHTSNLNLAMTNALFDMKYMAKALGSNVESGGVSLQEEGLTVAAGGTTVTLTKTPVAFSGSVVGWYKLPGETEWKTGSITGSTMTVAGATAGQEICTKYFYNDLNATHFVANAQYVPSILHVVMLVDLFKGSSSNFDSSAIKAGRLLIDIPQLQLDGSQNLALTSTSAATISLNGSALAVEDNAKCSAEPVYGTFTQQLFDTVWQNEVTALAITNADVILEGVESETLVVKALRTGTLPFTVAPADLTYTVVSGGTYASVSATGVVTGITAGEALVKVELKNAPAGLEPAFASVIVS